ncbi:MAG: hypothetical protein NTY51_07650, partial [Deltaproteobacteria bacterium]|nr:hypothetical protein [Deltaproteobacteria bacterium]
MFKELYPIEKERLINYALAVTEGCIELFGWKPVSVSIPSINLQDNYVNEIIKDWGASYYWDVNFYHDKDNPSFDIKWLWELERLQFLLWLGAAWKLTGDDKFSSLAREILDTWFNRLKYPYGVEWSSNLEVGLRLLSISRCHIMCMDSPSWDAQFVSNLVSWEYLHAVHLREELTLHHTLGNHQLGEAGSLLWFAMVNPGLRESDVWKKYAFKIINKIVPNLIFSDGVYTEQSTSYLKLVAEFLLPLIFVNGFGKSGFSPTTLKRVESCLKFVQSV